MLSGSGSIPEDARNTIIKYCVPRIHPFLAVLICIPAEDEPVSKLIVTVILSASEESQHEESLTKARFFACAQNEMVVGGDFRNSFISP